MLHRDSNCDNQGRTANKLEQLHVVIVELHDVIHNCSATREDVENCTLNLIGKW